MMRQQFQKGVCGKERILLILACQCQRQYRVKNEKNLGVSKAVSMR
jgi:hypothetical protein